MEQQYFLECIDSIHSKLETGRAIADILSRDSDDPIEPATAIALGTFYSDLFIELQRLNQKLSSYISGQPLLYRTDERNNE